MEIKTLQKSNTFASLASGGQRLGTWFDRRARKISMKCSKSLGKCQGGPIVNSKVIQI